jgi:hypothetical protein
MLNWNLIKKDNKNINNKNNKNKNKNYNEKLKLKKNNFLNKIKLATCKIN